MRPVIARVLSSRLSAIGVALTTASALLFLILLALDLSGALQNPYDGILIFLIMPALFVLGLILIPMGLRRSRLQDPAAQAGWPTFKLGDPPLRHAVIFVVVATAINVVILSVASFGAVHYSESEQFCGQACHTPMTPEFTAHGVGPHANVTCVSCHVGPGARGFIAGKMAGTRQLYLFTRGTFHRPIPTPVHNLPAVEGTCLTCHWADRNIGDIEKTIYEHADDEANTPTATSLLLHVGGARAGTGSGKGIHWHANPTNIVEYVATDDTREQISYVRASRADGTVREYFAEKVTPESIAGRPRRRMDCTDCHNRPAHSYSSSAARDIDAALGAGLIDAKVPFVRREAVRALVAEYPTREAAFAQIEQSMRDALKGADEAALRRAIEVTQGIYRRSVFPDMKITFGTYPNQRGHTVSTGCFRCHDEAHTTRDGLAISQDCETCHTMR